MSTLWQHAGRWPLWLALLALCWPGASQAQAGPAVDLRAPVYRILHEHCWECHDSVQRAGGLDLESLAGLQRGGFSGRSLVADRDADNALIQRIASTDPTVRMPQGRPPLHPSEQQILRDWLAQGAPWPDEEIERRKHLGEPFSRSFVARLGRTLTGESNEVPGVKLALALLLVLALLTVLAARLRRTAADTPAPAAWRRVLAWSSPGHGLVAAFLLCAATGGFWLWCEYRDQVNAVAQLADALQKAKTVPRDIHAVYGSPPRPPRPFRPAQLAGTYYRGNLDRHPALFHGGNFRTATIRVSLRDAAGNKLHPGDAVEDGAVVIRLDVTRAAHTPEALIGDPVLAQWFVSASDLTGGPQGQLPADAVRFAAVEPGRRWVADVPLVIAQRERDGFNGDSLYVYRAPVDWNSQSPVWPQCEYVVVHYLPLLAGRLLPIADLWLGPVLVRDQLAQPQPRRIPLEEWLDDRPIPQLPGPLERDPYGPDARRALSPSLTRIRPTTTERVRTLRADCRPCRSWYDATTGTSFSDS